MEQSQRGQATHDLPAPKIAEREREIAVEFLSLVNASAGVDDLIQGALRFFRKQSGCQAVGIRLREGDDYPYYQTDGFPEEFVRLENSLCVRSEGGEVDRDSAGNAALTCMCGNVICGRFDPTKPFFSPQGSFWANDTTRLLATTTEADRQVRTRDRCNGEGYESVALIALRVGEQRLGLLQLNDKRKNMFTPELIAIWERLAGYLAVALAQAIARKSLRQSEEMHRVFFELGVVGMAYATADERLVKVNDKYCEITGYTREELTGMSLRELTHPDDREADRDAQDRYFHGQLPAYASEKRYLRKDGSVRWVGVRARMIYEPDGRPRYSIGIIEDITQRKQARLDQELANQVLGMFNRGSGDLHILIGEVLRAIRESIGFDAVGLRLREGDDCPYYQQDGFSDEFLREENFLCAKGLNGSILRDECGGAILECTCGVVLGGRADPTMPCFTPGGSFWSNQASQLLALAPEHDPRTNPRNRCIHAGYESVALLPVRCCEQIVGLLQLNDRQPGRFTLERIRFFEGLANNFGLALMRRQAEDALKAATLSAEQASKAKDHFLAVLSHELRNPLNPVLATANMLRDDPRFDADTREQLEVICRNAELEARLIDDLLDVTRIERGKVDLDRRPIELSTIIRRATEVCMPDIEARKLHFDVDAPDGPYLVDADAARLQQVFWNLLKNAIKFTPVGGRVGVRCHRERWEGREGGGVVVAEVSDSGEGIEGEALGRIFNAFEQAERSITRQFGGLGLGLTISKALVELHGGAIAVRSEGKGKGATFTVRLPLSAAAGSALPTCQAPPSATLSQSLRILLVEDHGDTARIMCRLLSAAGHEVKTAADVATALRLAEEGTFDLLLSDLGLPDGSGLDLIRATRAKGLNLPGIALSGYGQEQDVQQSHEAGFAAHLVKPVSLPKLQEAIARLFDRSGAEVTSDR